MSGVSAGMFSARKSPQLRASGASSSAQELVQEPGIGRAAVHRVPGPVQQTDVMACACAATSAVEHTVAGGDGGGGATCGGGGVELPPQLWQQTSRTVTAVPSHASRLKSQTSPEKPGVVGMAAIAPAQSMPTALSRVPAVSSPHAACMRRGSATAAANRHIEAMARIISFWTLSSSTPGSPVLVNRPPLTTVRRGPQGPAHPPQAHARQFAHRAVVSATHGGQGGHAGPWPPPARDSSLMLVQFGSLEVCSDGERCQINLKSVLYT